MSKMMRLLTGSAFAIVYFAIAIFVGATGADAQRNERHIALKGGESADLRNFFVVANCQSTLVGVPSVEILEGPDELTVSFRPELVLPRTLNCPKPVPGGIVVAKVGNVKEPVEAKLTFRLKFNTKAGERQTSDTYIVSLYPAGSGTGNDVHTAPTNPTESNQPTSPH
jgi:hypothetical protein